MSIKLADTLAPMSNDFPAVEGTDIDVTINGASKRLQSAIDDGDLAGGGSAIQVNLLPAPSVDELGKIYQYVGSSGTYQNGFFYTCVASEDNPPIYSWVQKNVQPTNATASDSSYDNTTSGLSATNVQDAIDEIKGGLGTASGKDSTDLVRPNSHELVESGSVYSAINNALSSIYTPRGKLTCAELTSALLIEANVGNVYQMSDSGTTSALFINGAGITINVNDNVGIIKAGADSYMFNYMGSAFDLTDYQKKDLSSPIAGASTVEGAIAQNTSDIEKIKAYTAVSNTDANTLTTTGLYYLTTGCTNIPSAYCILQVQSKNTTSISDDIAQYTVNTDGNQYSRVRVNGTWSSWQKLANQNYLDTQGVLAWQRVSNGVNDANLCIPELSGAEQYWGLSADATNAPVGGSWGTVYAIRSGTTIKQWWSKTGGTAEYMRSIECDSSGQYISTNQDWKQLATTDLPTLNGTCKGLADSECYATFDVTFSSWGGSTPIIIGIAVDGAYVNSKALIMVNNSIEANSNNKVHILYADGVNCLFRVFAMKSSLYSNTVKVYVSFYTAGTDDYIFQVQQRDYIGVISNLNVSNDSSGMPVSSWFQSITQPSAPVLTTDLTSSVTANSNAPLTSGGCYDAIVKRYPTGLLYPSNLGLAVGEVALEDLCTAINTTIGSDCCIHFTWDSSSAIGLNVNGTVVSLAGSVLQGHFEAMNSSWKLSEGWFTDEEGNMYSFRCRNQTGTVPSVVIKKLS